MLFAVTLDGMSRVTGFTEEGSVTLTCEVRGYTTNTNPSIIWSAVDRDLTDSSKYIVRETTGSNQLISYSGNSTTSSIISTLEIRELCLSDQGSYTCMVGRESLTTALFVMAVTTHDLTTSPASSNAATSTLEENIILSGSWLQCCNVGGSQACVVLDA